MSVDPAFHALLEDPRMALREPPAHLSIDVLRQAANAFMGASKGPDVAEVEDIAVDANFGVLPVRLYRPALAPQLPLILFIHGGGFVFGSIATHDAMCRSLACHSGAIVASVEYRHAPEVRFPEPLSDCVSALSALVARSQQLGIEIGKVAIVGDSAGGQLAIATALATADSGPQLTHLGLLYPLLDPQCNSDSSCDYAEGFMLTRSFLRWCWGLYGAPAADPAHPLFDLAQADLASLPSATIITAEYDPLRDEGEAFAARLADAGKSVTSHRFPGMIHGFAGFPHLTPRADEAIMEIGCACKGAFETQSQFQIKSQE